MPAKFEISTAGTSPSPPVGARFLLLLPALALLGIAASAAAQSVPPDCREPRPEDLGTIRPGTCFRSVLGPEDPKVDGDLPLEVWRLPLAAGEAVRIDLDAIPQGSDPYSGFDTYLEVRGPGLGEGLANDDRPGSVNSTIRFTAPADGVYTIRAFPLTEVTGGPYTLRVSPGQQATLISSFSPGRLEIPIERFAGSPGGDTILVSRLFDFTAVPGERVRFVAAATTAAEGGIVMTLYDAERRVVGSTSSAGLEGALLAVLPQGGPHQLEVQVPSGPQPGTLTLTVQRRPHGSDRIPRPIAVGGSHDGELKLDSHVDSDPYGSGLAQAFNERYELPLRAGEPVTVEVESTAFDPVVDAGALSPLGFAAAVTDDDGGVGTNARLVLRPIRGGSVVLRVRAVGGQIGGFRISVVAGETAAPAEQGRR